MADMAQWEVVLVTEVAAWFEALAEDDWDSAEQVEDAIDVLAATGPTLGRPLGDRIKGADSHHLAGDKAGNWQRWYDVNIPIAEKRYQAHVTDLETREYE
jgi:hypothetical protein